MSHVSYVTLFVAQAIINLTASHHDDSFSHDDYIQRNFWGYVKNVIKVKDRMLPTFTMPRSNSNDGCCEAYLWYLHKKNTTLNGNKISFNLAYYL